MVKAIVGKQPPLHLGKGYVGPVLQQGSAWLFEGFGWFGWFAGGVLLLLFLWVLDGWLFLLLLFVGCLLFGGDATQGAADKHGGSTGPCVTMEEASTNRQIF